MPSFLASVDGDSTIDEPGANGAFHFADSVVKSLSVFDQRSKFAVCFGGHVDRLELVHVGHAGELESVVLVGFSFDVGPLPRIFVGGAYKSFASEADSQVVNPARGAARFHDDQVAFGFLEKRGQVIAFGFGVDEHMFCRF